MNERKLHRFFPPAFSAIHVIRGLFLCAPIARRGEGGFLVIRTGLVQPSAVFTPPDSLFLLTVPLELALFFFRFLL